MRSRERLTGRADTAETIRERLAHRAAAERINKERAELFPVITVENAAEVMAWQERRFAELLKAKGAK